MLTKQATAKASCQPAGQLGCKYDKVRRLTLKTLQQGSNHFRVKVGVNFKSDHWRGRVSAP